MKDVKQGGGFTKKAGDVLERVGEKLTNVGATKIGKKIYDSGNKLEHKGERDDAIIKKPIP